MSQQAGSHKQDSTVLHVNRRHMTPQVLKAGVPPQVANRIKELHLRLDQVEDTLPEWLDVISSKFRELERLYLTRVDEDEEEDGDYDGDDGKKKKPKRRSKNKNADDSQRNQLRRLYILYRLPHLVEIDGIPVTKSERRLARPDDPNGVKMASKSEWCHLGDDGKKRQFTAAAAGGGGGEEDEVEEEGVEIGEDQTPITPRTYKKKKASKGIRDFVQQHDKENGNDDYRHDDEEEKSCSDLQMDSSLIKAIPGDSAEGYELDLDLEDAIQRAKGPGAHSSSPQGGQRQSETTKESKTREHSDKERREYVDRRQPSSPTKKNKSNPKSRGSPTKTSNHHAKRGEKDQTLEYVACDSTVTSEYGYGHWAGACFAPFQMCTGRTRQKTKQAFVARKHAPQKQSSNVSTADDNTSNDESNTGSTTQPTMNTVDDHHHYYPKSPQPDPPMDQTLSPNPKPSSKYSSMVDETVQKQDAKQRKKLFRDSVASQGCSTAHSSRKSYKYSRLLVELEDEERGGARSRNSDDDESSQTPQSRRRQHQQFKKNESGKQYQQSSKPAKTHASSPKRNPSSPSRKEKQKKIPVIPLEEDEIGTMTGVSIEVKNEANAAMSVATIPTVLRREAEKLRKSKQRESTHESENLATRRNMTGVTIDVPPHTPHETTKEPTGKIKKAPRSAEKPNSPKKNKGKSDERKLSPGKSRKQKEEPPKDLQAIDTETFEAMDDPDIVDMVMNKLGNQNGKKKLEMSPSLQLPHLSPTPTVTNKQRKSEQTPGRRDSGGGASVASESRSVQIYNKVKQKKKQKASKGGGHGTAANAKDEDSSDSSPRSKENLNDLETRLNSLIAGSRRLKDPTTPLSKKDRKLMAETVSKLDENLKSILDQQQNSPEKRATPTRSKRRQKGNHKDFKDNDQQAHSSNMTEASPLSKLETSMGQLFSTIMAQMSPSKRALGSPATHSILQKKKEKQREDTFFSRETPKTLEKLDPTKKQTKPDDEDSTLFVVEIQKDEADESLTNVDFRPGNGKFVTEAPSVINLVEPSVQSSVTGFQQTGRIDLALVHAISHNDVTEQQQNKGLEGPPSLPSLTHEHQTSHGQHARGQLNLYANNGNPKRQLREHQVDEERDPTIIDLTDKSTIVTSPPPGNRGSAANAKEEIINLLDVQSQQLYQAKKQNQRTSSQEYVPQQAQEVAHPSQNQTHSRQQQQYQPQKQRQLYNQQFSQAKKLQGVVSDHHQDQLPVQDHLPDTRVQQQYSNQPYAATQTPVPNQHVASAETPCTNQNLAQARQSIHGQSNQISYQRHESPYMRYSQPSQTLQQLSNQQPVNRSGQQQDFSRYHGAAELEPQPQAATNEWQFNSNLHKENSAYTDIGTGGNATFITHHGSKLGMVLNLATIKENVANFGASADEEIDGHCVAAAAAGAAAGAEARGDDDDLKQMNTYEATESEYPSELPTNNAIKDSSMVTKSLHSPPREIVTQSNPIMAVLQAPIYSSKEDCSTNKAQFDSEGAVIGLADRNSYPKEVLVSNDSEAKDVKEPAFIATLLTEKPSKSNLSSVSQKEDPSVKQSTLQETLRTPNGTRLPKEIVAMVYEAMNRYPHEDRGVPGDSPSPQKGPKNANQLPREILALLEERQGVGPSLSEEARAVLPYEFAAMLDEAYTNDEASGPPIQICTGEPESPAISEGFPQSLPREVTALQIPDPPSEDEGAEANLPPTPANPGSSSGQSRLHYFKSRISKPFGLSSNSVSSQKAGETQADNETPTIPSHVIRTNVDANFDYGAQENNFGGSTECRDSQDIPHSSSLPSNVVINHDESGNVVSCNKKVPPSRSLASPFPLQFRERVAKPSANLHSKPEPTNKPLKNSVTSETQSETGSTRQGFFNAPSESSSKFPMKQITVGQNQDNNMETIASPASSTREDRLSPRLQSRAKNPAELPPPCPTSQRRSISSMTSPRSEKMLKAFSRWKDKRAARGSSIMDGMDEDEDDDEDFYDSYEDGEAYIE